MNFFITKKVLVGVILFLCALIFVIWFTGCGRKPAPLSLNNVGTLVGPGPAAPALKKGETKLDQAYDNRAYWDARIAVEQEKADRELAAQQEKAKRDKAEERQLWLERICRAVIIICFIGVLANVGLFILSFKFDWFGGMRNAAVAGVVANIVIICLVWYIPGYIAWVAGLVVLGAGISAVCLIRNMHGLGCEVRSAQDAITTVIKKVV